MNRRDAIQVILGAGAGSFFSVAAQDYVLRSGTSLVLLDVSVRDHLGHPVAGLKREDFRLVENGKTQAITAFDALDHPATLGILIDESGSMAPKRIEVQAAAEALIANSNSSDDVFIVHFNDAVEFGLPAGIGFSRDRAVLRKAVERGVPRGKTALNDAVLAALDHLKLGELEKKSLVIISDGGDNASRGTREETVARVQAGTATIYGIGIYDEDTRDRDIAFLRRLVEASGGDAYFPRSTAGLTPLCVRIADEVRSRYTIGYVPPRAKTTEMRTVKVAITKAGGGKLRVRTRPRYRYLPEAG